MNEQLERQESWQRAIRILAFTPTIVFIPLALSLYFLNENENIAWVCLIVFMLGLLFFCVMTINAFAIFFSKPRLTLGNPISQKTLWTLIAAASPLITIFGFTLQEFRGNSFSFFNGIDLLSGTFIYGSFVLYIYAIFRTIKELRKNS